MNLKDCPELNQKLLFYLLDILTYPLLVYIIVDFFIRLADFRTGTDAAGAAMTRAFAYLFWCAVSCTLFFIVSFFVSKMWLGSIWHAVPAMLAGVFVIWLIPQAGEWVRDHRTYAYTDYYGSGLPRERGRKIGTGGKLHGEITFYREDGGVERIERWQHGRQHGRVRTFYENGQLSADGKTCRGVQNDGSGACCREGRWKFYREDGTPDDEREYSSGLPVASEKYRYYWVNAVAERRRSIHVVGSGEPFTGRLEQEGVVDDDPLPFLYTGQVVDGVFEGPWSGCYNRPGRPLAACGTAVSGRNEGVYTAYYSNGQIWETATYRDGRIEGEHIEYYADSAVVGPHGRVSYSCAYENGKRNGTARWYREDGTLEVECGFVDGKLHGTRREYDERGELISEKCCEDGRLCDGDSE